ncbi:MAG: GGDEF domain-containing protein [Sphingomonadaceae bacterium]
MMILDIDQFKLVNDHFGHDTGDEVMMIVATLLSNYATPSIHVARLGGEEFALVGNVLDLTPNLASTILEDIQSAEMPHGEELTASIGMAFGTLERVGDWSELYGQADRALYAAKADGRNRAFDFSTERDALAIG